VNLQAKVLKKVGFGEKCGSSSYLYNDFLRFCDQELLAATNFSEGQSGSQQGQG
jgi:hypothetical protein